MAETETRTQTLLSYLRTPDPMVYGHNSISKRSSKSNTKSNKWRQPTSIGKWEDFDYDTLTTIFNGDLNRVLQKEHDFQNFSALPFIPFCRYFDENSLESLLIKWNQSVVLEALAISQGYLKSPADRVFMVRGGQAKFWSPEIKSKPDWACVRFPVPTIMEKQRNLLPGETKVSTKWSSSLIRDGPTDDNGMSMNEQRPLNQIYSYCLNSMTRYGYIITDKELVVVRVRFDQKSDSQQTFEGFDTDTINQETHESFLKHAEEVGILDYKVIPWTTSIGLDSSQSSNDLTVNLALWWLHLLATGENKIADEKTYGALRDEESSIWGSVMSDPESPALQSRSMPHRNGAQRGKSKANKKKLPIDRRASKDGVHKRGRSQGRRSAKSSFETR